jgi:Bacterial regulatory proteins, tetR family
MADLMEATGLEKGGIYRHFSTKGECSAKDARWFWNYGYKRMLYEG